MTERRREVESFAFTQENKNAALKIISRYPAGKQQSAVMPLLYLAQKQNDGWISTAAMNYIAQFLSMPEIKVYEVATFYSMYNKKPVGKYLIQLCRTTPCWLCGSDEIRKACEKNLGISLGETTPDNKFTLVEVECLGACIKGPAIQINDDYHENLTPESVVELLKSLP